MHPYPFGIKESQWRYYRFWLIITVICEIMMVLYHRHLTEIYFLIAILFLAGFLLRTLKLYPGESEPLILDFSAFLIALGFACLVKFMNDSILKFLLIFCSSAIIVPHFIYIAREK